MSSTTWTIDDSLRLVQNVKRIWILCVAPVGSSTCHLEKRVGPVILLDFGGIELNTVRMEIRLPPVKLMRTKELRTA